MRAVVQRVRHAAVRVADDLTGEIDLGLLILIGAGNEDTEQDAAYLAKKIVGLRIFEDEKGLMNRSVGDAGGKLLVVSQFTLYGDCRKGRRPSFVAAMAPPRAEALYEYFVSECRAIGIEVQTGRFGAMMDVELCNMGPVTLMLDSQKQF